MKLYIKIFIYSSVPFGLVMAIYYSFRFGITEGIFRGTMAGILFGVALATILGTIQVFFQKKIISSENCSVKQQQYLELNLGYDMVFALCLNSVKVMPNWTVEYKDVKEGEIKAKTGPTWKSWGEDIRIRIKKMSDTQIVVDISSKPSLPTILVDYGKNAQNVNQIVTYLQDNSTQA